MRSGTLNEKLIEDSASVPITESSLAEDASDEEAVEVDADCACPARCTLSKFCSAAGAEIVRDSCLRCGVDWNAYGCTGEGALLYAAVLFDPLYMLLGAWPRRGDCCGGPWKASEEEGRECSIVMVLEDVMGSGSTSAMGLSVGKIGGTKVITDMECRAWRRGGYVYYLSRPAVSDGVSRRGRARKGVMVDGDQWQMGEVDVDGWESGPLSQSKKAARACGSRHACDTTGECEGVVKEAVGRER